MTMGSRAVEKLALLRVPRRVGIVSASQPDHLFRLLGALRRWGKSPAAGATAMAGTYPDETWVIDELGELSFGEMGRRSNALADSLLAAGVKPGDAVGLMCRNSRYFVDSTIACAKAGAVLLLLNTDFAAPQLAGVLEREQPVALIHDQEFEDKLAAMGVERRFIGWHDGAVEQPTIEELIEAGDDSDRKPPEVEGRVTILSSGTTGTPKGVQREGGGSLLPLFGYLDRVGFQARDTHVVAPPMFHGWGLFHLGLSFLLGTTVVMRRRFDPEGTLEMIAENKATSAAMVPVMLQRILELPPEALARHDTSSLRAIPLGGSAVPGDLAPRAMDAFGEVVFNTYGSTEVALASTATPADLRRFPHTAGFPMPATEVEILDDAGRKLPQGETGTVFVGSDLRSDGYSGGGNKLEVDGMLSSGDLGHFDDEGLLFIDGREDDMIVSGGENVYPGEIEDLLASHPAVSEAAVIGVEDDQFGQRMQAFVCLRDGEQLSAEQVREHVKANLARYKVPREVEFLDALPRNPTGKVLKRELSAR